jgi:N-acetylneuraminic acid mutarotase
MAKAALTGNFIKGTLYVVGGVDASGVSDRMMTYDPNANQWIEKAPMPTPREHLASAVVNDKLYVMGGRVGGYSHNLDAVEVYDPATDKWSILESMPSQRGGLASATLNNMIYVFGGERPNATFNNNEEYNPATNKWTSSIPMPTARHGLAAVPIENKIYVVGGGLEPGLATSGVNEIYFDNTTAN